MFCIARNRESNIDFRLGFRVEPRINLMFRKVVEDLVRNFEVDITSRYDSLSRKNVIGDFRFVVMEKYRSYDYDLPFYQKIFNFLRHFSATFRFHTFLSEVTSRNNIAYK